MHSEKIDSISLKSKVDNLTANSPYVDTLSLSFTDQNYVIYIEKYSEQGPKGSFRNFLIVDEKDRGVFSSFKDDLEESESSPDETWEFNMYPNYQVIQEDTMIGIRVNLLYDNEQLSEAETYDSGSNISSDFIGMKTVPTDHNLYQIGLIQNKNASLIFTPFYKSYKGAISIDSLTTLYEIAKDEEIPSTINLLYLTYHSSLTENIHSEMYDSIASFCINDIRANVEFHAEEEKYFFLFKFISYHQKILF